MSVEFAAVDRGFGSNDVAFEVVGRRLFKFVEFGVKTVEAGF